MKRPLLGGAVAEEVQRDIALFADLQRPRHARGMRDAGADDAGCAKKTALHIREMHGSAAPFAKAVHAPENLRHHRLRIAAENQWVAVATVSGQGRIAFLEMTERTHDGGFCTIRQMRMPADDAGMLGKGALDGFLKSADAQHLGVHPDLPLRVRCLTHLIPSCGVIVGRPWAASHFSRAAVMTFWVFANASVAAVSKGHLRMYSFSTSTPIGPS